MIKKDISYEDFNGNHTTDTHYFHLGKSELIELEVEYEGGLYEAIERISAAEDHKQIVAIFKKLVLLAHGVKSADGKSFIKSDEARVAFSQTGAYDALFMELATDDKAGAEFIKGIMPSDMALEIAKLEELAAAEAAQKAQAEIAAREQVKAAEDAERAAAQAALDATYLAQYPTPAPTTPTFPQPQNDANLQG